MVGKKNETKKAKTDTAMFAAGCFWHVEDDFAKIPGVISTMVGYTGGKEKNPTYQMVCSNNTGHAETVRVEYDPNKVNFKKLIEVFWEVHDPTTMNRQGLDVGEQYRSAIFYANDEQKKVAELAKKELQDSGKHGDRKVVTQIAPATEFYRAEEYHQKYYDKKRSQPGLIETFRKTIGGK